MSFTDFSREHQEAMAARAENGLVKKGDRVIYAGIRGVVEEVGEANMIRIKRDDGLQEDNEVDAKNVTKETGGRSYRQPGMVAGQKPEEEIQTTEEQTEK